MLPQKCPRLVSLPVIISAAGHGGGKEQVVADMNHALK